MPKSRSSVYISDETRTKLREKKLSLADAVKLGIEKDSQIQEGVKEELFNREVKENKHILEIYHKKISEDNHQMEQALKEGFTPVAMYEEPIPFSADYKKMMKFAIVEQKKWLKTIEKALRSNDYEKILHTIDIFDAETKWKKDTIKRMKIITCPKCKEEIPFDRYTQLPVTCPKCKHKLVLNKKGDVIK